MNRKKILNMVLCALFAALTAVGAFLKIPIPGLPITLQNFFTQMAGLFLGPWLGAISVLVYVAIGLSGVPIFTAGGGLGYVFQPSFGYLVAFAVGAFVTGFIANRKKNPSYVRVLIANLAGLVVIYAIGMTYFYCIKNFYMETPMGVKALFATCFVPCIAGDLIKCFLGAYIGKRLIPVIGPSKRK